MRILSRLITLIGVVVATTALMIVPAWAEEDVNCYTPLSCLVVIGPIHFDDVIGS